MLLELSDLEAVTGLQNYAFGYAEVAPRIHSAAWKAPTAAAVRGADRLLGSVDRMRNPLNSPAGLHHYPNHIERGSHLGVQP
ncbi:hypothetical protein SAMN05444745_109150 [Arthrobacter sp. OV608]|nr:hypothetical protein SAMN05444745_109150 [Arthrobacter sp. OV608]